VYFGTYFDPNSPLAFIGNLAASNYDPGTLEPDTRYFWRIDDVEADDTIHTGDVWSFTTGSVEATNPSPADDAEDVSIDVVLSWDTGYGATSHNVYFGTSSPPALIGNQTASDYEPYGLEPGVIYYWKIDEVVPVVDGPPIIHEGDVWSFTIGFLEATNPSPADGAEDVPTDVLLSWDPGKGAVMHDVYFGTSSPPPFTGRRAASDYNPGTLELGTSYFWKIDEFTPTGTNPGPVWSFTTMSGPEKATNPYPADGATNVPLDVTCTWDSGWGATAHDVYFGTDEQAVATANPGSPEYKGRLAFDTEWFIPQGLRLGSPYFWKINELVPVIEGPPIVIEGDVWEFTTVKASESGTTLFSDDFESYSVGTFPSTDWEIVWDGTGENYVTDAYSFSPTKSLQLWGRASWSSVAQRKFSTDAPVIGYECAIRIDSIGTGGPGREESVNFFNRDVYIWS
jgi:hypothetical protein